MASGEQHREDVVARVLELLERGEAPAIEELASGGRCSWSVDVDAYDL